MSNAPEVEIRDARPDEMDAVRALTLEAYGEYAADMPSPNWEGLKRGILRTFSGPVTAETIVAAQGDELAGSVLLFPADTAAYGGGSTGSDTPELRLLAVRPSARGQGIGTMLMEECIDRARRAGAPALGLHSSASMAVAISMYERRGFERVPEHDFPVENGELVKAYRLDLN